LRNCSIAIRSFSKYEASVNGAEVMINRLLQRLNEQHSDVKAAEEDLET